MIELLEKSRQELLDKSKSADIVKRYGTTRYGRKDYQHIFNTVQNFNRIDFNALFKANILYLKLPVQGETDNYEVTIMFDKIVDQMKDQISLNNNICEFKCIYRALINAINSSDIYVHCTCPDFKYRHAFQATKGRYNSGQSQIIPAKVTNPNDTKGAGCKHIMKVLADLDWALKLATCINNYITYIRENMPDKFFSIMFPVLYAISYEEAEKLGIFDDTDDLANTIDNDDTDEIDQANGGYEAEEEPVEEPKEEEEL